MSTRKQVVFCTDGIFPHLIGGMQRHSALLVQELAKMKAFDLIVIHPHNNNVFDSSLGIKEIPLNYLQGNQKYISYCYKYSKKVMEQLQAFPNAIIYSQGLAVWHQSTQVKDRLIVNPHGLEPYQAIEMKEKLKTLWLRFAFNSLFRKSRFVVSLGGQLTSILKNITGDASKVIVIPNAVNPGQYIKREYGKNVLQLLFVGRFHHNKGIHVLMKAVEELNREGYKNRFVFNLVGKGPLFEEYKAAFQFPNVNYLGFVRDEDLPGVYNANDLFVLPTLYEGMPTVVLEAMSTGMPVVVSETGATIELVDGTNGYLIEKNNLRALKAALQRYYQLNALERETLSKSSFQKVNEKFTWSIVAQKHVDLFNTFNAQQ